MVEKRHDNPADMDEQRKRNNASDGGHLSDEKGSAHEFNNETESENVSDLAQDGGQRARKTRGGTHDQHVTAGKKGGSRIRQLIELGYKYEQEHGVGPGQNDRSKLSAKRRPEDKET
jgi:hypothetical protein